MGALKIARRNMIECQLRTNKVDDERLIDALNTVPREQFVPRHMQSIAYVDEDIALGNGRYLQEPTVFARMVQAAGIAPSDVVLDIGCGTGYSTAVLGLLCDTVVALEENKKMADKADRLINDLDICNTAVITKDLKTGYPEQGPYNVIFINGSVPYVRSCFFDQLAEGGRLVAVVAENGHMGCAKLFTKVEGGEVEEKILFDAAVPLLTPFKEEDGFHFVK